jgi:serine/threonine-protein kinase
MAEKIGKYEVLDQIGRGGMGTIFRARDPILERFVALKVISNLEVTPELRARFFREAQACARIAHPNIVIVHDMGEDSGRLFIVMELLEGEELSRVIARHGELSLNDKLGILRQICDGLHFAHQKGVVHRDVKPANILVLRTGQVKILDFGIAQIAGAATQRDLTRTGMFMGTLRYMAPEQVRGRTDRRSDIFSVAAVSYELLTGRPPFSGSDPLQVLEQLRTATPPRLTELDPSLPSLLADVIERALQKDPADRFADLGEMSGQLELLGQEPASDETPMARPSSLLGPPAAIAATPPTSATDRPPAVGHPPVISPAADASEPPRQWLEHALAPETARGQVSGVPRIAIATGVALVALVVVALYVWLPAGSRAPVGDRSVAVAPPTGAMKPETASAPPSPTPKTDETAHSAPETPREPDGVNPPARPEPRSSSARASSTAKPSAAATSSSTADGAGGPRREAGTTAGLGRSAGARADAEQARSGMTAARQAAERVAAGFYARNRFLSAQTKDRAGMAALGRSDYIAASTLFTEARSEYQAAAVEAPREEENQRKLAALRASLDEAHAAVAARRQEALAAQADQLARELFDRAQARQVEGDGLASRKDLAAAARAYQEAAAHYGEATARARAARPTR